MGGRGGGQESVTVACGGDMAAGNFISKLVGENVCCFLNKIENQDFKAIQPNFNRGVNI